MSIGGLMSATFSVAGATGLNPGGALANQPQTPADVAKAKADAAAAAQAATLAQIRQKGLHAWAQEQKMAALREKVRQQVLSEHKLDDAAYAKLGAKAQGSIDDEIAQRVKQTLQATLEDQAKSAAQQGKPPAPMIIDISV